MGEDLAAPKVVSSSIRPSVRTLKEGGGRNAEWPRREREERSVEMFKENSKERMPHLRLGMDACQGVHANLPALDVMVSHHKSDTDIL